jgi:hypothetical protein
MEMERHHYANIRLLEKMQETERKIETLMENVMSAVVSYIFCDCTIKFTSPYRLAGIYQISCPTCNKKYTGQIGRSFNTRFREHLRDFKNGYGKSRFAQHLLENRHAIGPVNDIMDTLFFSNKGRLMNAVENFFIFRETKLDNQLNDKLTVKQNIIFETIVREDPHRGVYDTCSSQQQIPSQSDLSAP